MKHYNLGFGTRREIRQHIEAAASKLSVSLQQNTIENMVTSRISEISKEIANGQSKVVDWESLVKQAAMEEARSRQQFSDLAAKLPTENNSSSEK